MLLFELVSAHQRLSTTRSRRKKLAELARCLERLTESETGVGVRYLSGELPQGRIGLGPAVLRRIDVSAAPTPTLTLDTTDGAFSRIAGTRGPGSQEARQRELAGLFRQATGEEQDFLRKLILGELRQGALDGLMAETRLPAAQVRRAVMLSGAIAPVAEAVLRRGAEGLAAFRLELFRPLQAMLAQPTDGPADAITRFGETAFEYKLDGARVQVHRDGDRVEVYTRQLHRVTDRVPEIVEAVRRLPVTQLVLDGEALAFAPDGRPYPFQVTMQRFGRRTAVDDRKATLPLSVRFFDCLYLNGDDLLEEPGQRRDEALRSLLPPALCVEREVTGDLDAADAFLHHALSAGHEGIMAKSLSAPYQAGNRGSDWLKIKPVHTLDLVVLAAEWGSGRRAGRLSNLHLGARDPATGHFVMLGKTFKGLTDQMLDWQTEALLAREIGRDGHTVHVRPELVVEVAFNELQRSTQYPGGLALRFARVKRYRHDKGPTEADSIATVREIHRHGFAPRNE